MKGPIRFGTSGHRGIISQTFTLGHVVAVGQAVASFLLRSKNEVHVAVGYDTRVGNSPILEEGSYTHALVQTLCLCGINVHFFDDYVPTPVVSWAIDAKSWDGGLILTASHNPPNYNGIKFNPADGAPASSDVTDEIQSLANQFFKTPWDFQAKHIGELIHVDACSEFSDALIQKTRQAFGPLPVDLSSFKIVVDARHGATGRYWNVLLAKLGVEAFTVLNSDPRTDFGGLEPNPMKPEALEALRTLQTTEQANLAAANDPDGDRHIVLDETGKMLLPEEIAAIILNFFAASDQAVGGIATTVASSGLIRKVAKKWGLEYSETRVGFKYFANFLKRCRKNGKIGFAVESSGGFSASFHTLEKCGFLPIVLLMFIMKSTGKTLVALRDEIYSEFGTFYFREIGVTFAKEKRATIENIFEEITAEELVDIFYRPVAKIIRKDGLKIIFPNGDWTLFRFSGTEPVARLYAESSNETTASQLLAAGENYLKKIAS